MYKEKGDTVVPREMWGDSDLIVNCKPSAPLCCVRHGTSIIGQVIKTPSSLF